MTSQAKTVDRVFEALASLRLGVSLMLGLGGVAIWATFYESAHGTAAAQRVFYQTRWFAGLLALLAVNILFSMLKRYPWTRHQAGFVLAHLGILLILAGSLYSLRSGLDATLALYEGETSDRVTLPGETIHVSLPASGVESTLPFEWAGGRQRLQAAPAVSVEVEEWTPHVQFTERVVEAAAGSPALHFRLRNAHGVDESGWLWPREPGRQAIDFGPLLFEAALAGSEHEAHATGAQGRSRVSFLVGPGARLRYVLESKAGVLPVKDLAVGEAIATPWMELGLTIDHLVEKAALQREGAPSAAPAKERERQPAARVRLLASGQRSEPAWIAWGESRHLPVGEAAAHVSYGPAHTTLPFRVTLLQFEAKKYPGSRMPSAFESRVRVEDQELGASEHLISMNRPLHHRGYIFFQSSYVEGQPMMSVFSVARSPGLPVVYLGTALMGVGALWMFYLKPYLARRQGRRALDAREAQPAQWRHA